MMIETIAMICIGQDSPTFHSACVLHYARCVEEGRVEQMRLNQKPDEGTLLTACILKPYEKR